MRITLAQVCGSLERIFFFVINTGIPVSLIINDNLSCGYEESRGRYAAPDLRIPINAVIISTDLSIQIPTITSGPAPIFIRRLAT